MAEPNLMRHDDAFALCAYCPSLCQHACPVATVEGSRASTPWALMSLAHHVATKRTRLDDDIASQFYHCAECRSCSDACSHDVDVAEALVTARAHVVSRGRAPYTKRDIQSHGQTRDPWWQGHGGEGVSERFQSEPSVLFLPGHSSLVASAGPVATFLEICAHVDDDEIACSEASTLDVGYDLWSGGFHQDFQAQARAVRDALRGAAHVVVMSPEALFTLRDIYPRFGCEISAELHHTSEFLLRFIAGVDIYPVRGKVAYHDACHLARHLGTIDVPREILRRVLAEPPLELHRRESHTRCCGATGCIPTAAPDTAEAMAESVVELALQSGADTLVSFAAECLTGLRRVAGDRLDVLAGVDLVRHALRGR